MNIKINCPYCKEQYNLIDPIFEEHDYCVGLYSLEERCRKCKKKFTILKNDRIGITTLTEN